MIWQNWLDICFDAMLEYIPEHFTTSEDTERFRTIAEHFDVIGGYLYAEETTNDNVAKFYSMAGIGHKEISNYDFALVYYFKSESIRQKNGNEKALGIVYNNIGVIYNIQANYRLALEYNHKSIEISERLNALPDDLAIAYNNLAIIYSQCTDYEKSLEWNTTALKTLEDNGLTDNPITADVFIMRSAIYYVCEKFDEALELDFKALDLLKNHYPEEHSDIGTAYNSIAREHYSLTKYDTALEYYLKAHRIYKTIYGEDDSDTAEVCGNISKTYVELQKYSHALEWCLKALETQEKILGKEHPETILRHSFISEIYEHLELFEEAISHLLKILDFYRKIEHTEMLKILCERISDDYEKINNLTESGKYRKMAFEAGGRNE